MPEFDFKSPFDELRELREVLTAQQIAELTGLRRETISRARPDSRFQRRTEEALADLYAIVNRMTAVNGGELGQLAAVLRRPQPVLGDRSIAELLRDGRADAVLEHLSAVSASEADPSENVRLPSDVEAEMRAIEGAEEPNPRANGGIDDRRVDDLLAADPELGGRLPMIEARIREWFGTDVAIKRTVAIDHEEADGRERLYLRLRSGRPFADELDRLAEFFEREEDLIATVEGRLTIGNI